MGSIEPKVEWLASVLCLMVGINPTDPVDGSADWFLFASRAEEIIKDLESRGFKINIKYTENGGIKLYPQEIDG